MSKSTKKDAPRPYWQSEPHPEWCFIDHSDRDPVDERACSSEWSHRLPLSLHDATVTRYAAHECVDGEPREYAEAVELVTHVHQSFREREPRIVVGPECLSEGTTYELTVTEALELIKALTTAVDIAEGHANPGGPS